ncbi:hypothetical protein E8E11_005111 [Didymella keratinophila]|nr:hypothetical protein E8E11_005111 [Didymella keratinophila]
MVTKRKRDAAPGSASDIAANSQPQTKQAKQNSGGANRDYTAADIKAFEKSVSKIQDWSSKAVIAKHVQVIYWFHVEHLRKEECVKRYPNKEGKPFSMTNIFKVYNTYAPRFYAEKGLEYIPLGKRAPARAVKQKKEEEKKDKSPKKIKRNPFDVRLEELFPCQRHRSRSSPEGSDATDDAITFLCKTDSTTYGDPSGIQITRSSILRHCSTIRDFLLENPHIDTITYGPEISADTICRFAACITESLQFRLPDFVTTAYGTFEQEWGMAELDDLYVLAVTQGASAVCDLIIDQLIEDLRRPEPRIVVDEFREAWYFDALAIGPKLLNFLWLNDKNGFTFFANVLFSYGTKGYARMEDTHLANWHEGVKKAMIQTMEDGSVIDLFSASPSTICTNFHHHRDPTDVPVRLPETRPEPQTASAAAPMTSARPTLIPGRPRLEDFDASDQTPAQNTLHLNVPRFHLTHRKRPQSHIDNIMDDPIYQRAAYGIDRLRVHKTAHLDERLLYRNKKFNAHHDTAETNRLKLSSGKYRLKLFANAAILKVQTHAMVAAKTLA